MIGNEIRSKWSDLLNDGEVQILETELSQKNDAGIGYDRNHYRGRLARGRN